MDDLYISEDTKIEAVELAHSILDDIELNRIPLSNIAFKASRLARIIGDYETAKRFRIEASGYPIENGLVPNKYFQMGIKAGRATKYNDDGKVISIRVDSISDLEFSISTAQLALESAKDPDVSISSANPNQYVSSFHSNRPERNEIRNTILSASNLLSKIRSTIHEYVLGEYIKLRYSEISYNIFTNIQERVDNKVNFFVPDAVNRFISIYGNLSSDNPEDWSNAVTSCRRILKDLADALYPATNKKIKKEVNGKIIEISLGNEFYKNRLIAFIEDKSSSNRFKDIVGSHLDYIGERIESIYQASNKGAHETIIDKQEAERYTIFTYLLVGDILTISDEM